MSSSIKNPDFLWDDEQLLHQTASVQRANFIDFSRVDIVNFVNGFVGELIEEFNKLMIDEKNTLQHFFFNNEVELPIVPFNLEDFLSSTRSTEIEYTFGVFYKDAPLSGFGEDLFRKKHIYFSFDFWTDYEYTKSKKDLEQSIKDGARVIEGLIQVLYVNLKSWYLEISEILKKIKNPISARAIDMIELKLLENFICGRNIDNTNPYYKMLEKTDFFDFNKKYEELFFIITRVSFTLIPKELRRFVNLTPYSLNLSINVTEETKYDDFRAKLLSEFLDEIVSINKSDPKFFSIYNYRYIDFYDWCCNLFYDFLTRKSLNPEISGSIISVRSMAFTLGENHGDRDELKDVKGALAKEKNILILACLRLNYFFLDYESCKKMMFSIYNTCDVVKTKVIIGS